MRTDEEIIAEENMKFIVQALLEGGVMYAGRDTESR